MTAPGPIRSTPGGTAPAGRPSLVVWALLLIGLLAGLPCASSARAAASPGAPAHTPAHAPAAQEASITAHAVRSTVRVPAHHRAHSTVPRADRAAASPPLPLTWCSPDDPGPRPGDGCSSHRYSGQDAQLPNAPPQPVPAALPQSVTPGAAPPATPVGAAERGRPAPDLHLLQVIRT